MVPLGDSSSRTPCRRLSFLCSGMRTRIQGSGGCLRCLRAKPYTCTDRQDGVLVCDSERELASYPDYVLPALVASDCCNQRQSPPRPRDLARPRPCKDFFCAHGEAHIRPEGSRITPCSVALWARKASPAAFVAATAWGEPRASHIARRSIVQGDSESSGGLAVTESGPVNIVRGEPCSILSRWRLSSQPQTSLP